MKHIYKFGNGITEGSASDKDLLGGKGANLQEMSKLGLNIPAGFTIPFEVPEKSGTAIMMEHVVKGLTHIQGDLDYWPLVSIRSGASVSMPGMMESILNVGLTTENLYFWSKKLTRKVAYDSYCRLIRMMGETIYAIGAYHFDTQLKDITDKYGVKSYYDLHAIGYAALANRYKNVYKSYANQDFPNSFQEQVELCIVAVFKSWNTHKAKTYRKIHGLSDEGGTACTVQAMVFGNLNTKSMTGVLFSRNPNTGEEGMVGEYLVNAQGEDVVNGSTTPKNIKEMKKEFPAIFNKLDILATYLDEYYIDMQDVEFTVQDGELFILQTRTGKRTAEAAFKIVRDFYKDGLITKDEILKRISSQQYFAMKVPVIDPSFKIKPEYTGLAAGGPLVSGVVVTSADDAVNFNGECILVTEHTTPDDVAGMNASKGILTRTGGMTCHAAVVGRGMNKTCVVGCSDLPQFIGGEQVTIDGQTGNIWIDIDVPVISGGDNEDVLFFEGILKTEKRLKVAKDITDTLKDGDVIKVRKDNIKQVIKKLKGLKKLKLIYLHIESSSRIVYAEQDKDVSEMFGASFDPCEGGYKEALEALSDEDVSNNKKRFVIDMPESQHKIQDCPELEFNYLPVLHSKGFEFTDILRNAGQLLYDTSVLKITKESVSIFRSEEELYEMIECTRKAGKKFEIMPEVMSISEAVIKYL